MRHNKSFQKDSKPVSNYTRECTGHLRPECTTLLPVWDMRLCHHSLLSDKHLLFQTMTLLGPVTGASDDQELRMVQ